MPPIDNADYLLQQAQRHGIHDQHELANFMGQMQVESGGFTHMSENLNYSGSRLLEVFPGRNGMDTIGEANAIAEGGPQTVANAIYGGRWGKLNLGNIEHGDGWRYHGRGYVQLTGRDNYGRVGEALGLDLINHPELAENREYAARIALLYWDSRVVAQGHQTDVYAACRDINGGSHGLAEREQAAANWATKIGRQHVPGIHHVGLGLDVRQLQHNLNDLGYTDAHGHRLKADGDFGPHTRLAVEAFQRDHHLVIDGKVGTHTRQALAQSLAAVPRPAVTLLSDIRHPDHALYGQALAGVKAFDAGMGRTPDRQSENLAAALAVEARRQGLTSIDGVTFSEDGSRTFALQRNPFSPVVQTQTADAVNTSLEQSSAAWFRVAQDQQAAARPSIQETVAQTAPSPGMGR